MSPADKISLYFPSIKIFRIFCQKEEDLLPLFHIIVARSVCLVYAFCCLDNIVPRLKVTSSIPSHHSVFKLYGVVIPVNKFNLSSDGSVAIRRSCLHDLEHTRTICVRDIFFGIFPIWGRRIKFSISRSPVVVSYSYNITTTEFRSSHLSVSTDFDVRSTTSSSVLLSTLRCFHDISYIKIHQ